MVLFIEFPKCSTCKKAKKWLVDNNIEFKDRNIVENTPTEKELKKWITDSKKDIKKFFNTSGLKYKELNLKEKLPNMTDNEKLKSVSVKIWGKKCFKETFYYKTGEKNKTKYWLMGLLLSAVTYYKDGNIYTKEIYRKGKLSKVKVYDTSGEIISKEKY